MRILFIGDVVSTAGCEFVRRVLPSFKKLNSIDFCIINGENSAKGNGITPQSAEHLLASGADIITTGNHVFRRQEIYDELERGILPVLRPQNMHRSAPGNGTYILRKGSLCLGVANILGNAFIDGASNAFDCADEIVAHFEKESIKNIFIDFHAEATGEKRAMGFYLDGRVSALIGTHTHVQTADEQILPGGTAYMTDVGMTGVINSVLGVKTENIVYRMRTGLPVKFENPDGPCSMGCVITETDNKTGKAVSIEKFCITK